MFALGSGGECVWGNYIFTNGQMFLENFYSPSLKKVFVLKPLFIITQVLFRNVLDVLNVLEMIS